MNIDFQEILKELEFRVPHGIINLNEESQVTTLVQILRENGVSDANEYAQRARVVFSYVNEVSKKVNPQDVLTQKVNNPDTGNDIMVGSALGYDKNKAVYKAAVARLKSAGASDDEILNIASKSKENIRGKSEPKRQQTKQLGGAGLKSTAETGKVSKDILIVTGKQIGRAHV